MNCLIETLQPWSFSTLFYFGIKPVWRILSVCCLQNLADLHHLLPSSTMPEQNLHVAVMHASRLHRNLPCCKLGGHPDRLPAHGFLHRTRFANGLLSAIHCQRQHFALQCYGLWSQKFVFFCLPDLDCTCFRMYIVYELTAKKRNGFAQHLK